MGYSNQIKNHFVQRTRLNRRGGCMGNSTCGCMHKQMPLPITTFSGMGLASDVAKQVMKEVYNNIVKPKRVTQKTALKWINERGKK